MKIPVTVITGFLGAGKTTLLRHLVANAKGRRLALVINEFGELGIDRELLLGCGDAACAPGDIVELANGCLCCKVADDFVPTIDALLAREPAPDQIVVETSGLALPKPLVKALAWPELRARLTVDGVIAMIDGPAFAAGRFTEGDAAAADGNEHESPLAEVFEDQLDCADLAIVNKSDALDEPTRARVAAELRARLRHGAKLIVTERARVDPRVALGLGAAAEDDLDARPSHVDAAGEHDHDDFTSFALRLPPIADPAAFSARLGEVIARHDVLRVKGFLDVPGKTMRLALQGVGPRLERHYDRPWRADEMRVSNLVVIGERDLDRAAIDAALQDAAR
jgi:cobalamin biosynthesis protein CobW